MICHLILNEDVNTKIYSEKYMQCMLLVVILLLQDLQRSLFPWEYYCYIVNRCLELNYLYSTFIK
jgi:hypothetical protein